MAKSKPTAPRSARTTTGTYFLSLTVENVRCFGPPQTLDLSDGHGRHARWTVILGENNTGKTTLLTSLAYFASVAYALRNLQKADGTKPHLWEWISGTGSLLRDSGDDEGKLQAVISHSRGREREAQAEIEIRKSGFTISHGAIPQFSTFHYGASRRMPQGESLAEYDDRVGIFLDDDVALRNPENWLLKADYNARLHGPDAERFETFAERVREAL
ncbi:MAG TPA: AAA family ATPase, partial [Geminicoccaceae bacterium]